MVRTASRERLMIALAKAPQRHLPAAAHNAPTNQDSMSQQPEKLAILFADISGSTMLYETLGNSLARQKVVRCLAMMSGRLAAHQRHADQDHRR